MVVLFRPGINPEEIPPLALAYLGDAVYELLVRQCLVGCGPDKVHNVHRRAVEYVRAETQARILYALVEDLNAEEKKFVRRGRNAKSGHIPKNASVAEYKYSTGFESLVGYLYLTGNEERLQKIMDEAKRVVEGDAAG